jgi:VWFA-related protein
MMVRSPRSGPVLVAGVVAAAVLGVSARQAPTPAPQGQTAPQQPVFRTGADVIRLDVSVLDKKRQPVRGLSVADFTVLEDGKAQRVVAVSEITHDENDPVPSAWMRHVTPTVAANDLSDRLGDGRIVAVVMDDFNVPWDSVDLVVAARAAGRDVIDRLGPSDVAAVVFPRDGGRTQDFTGDRGLLYAAVDGFEPREPDFPMRGNTYYGPGAGGGDMPERFSPVLGRSNCQRSQPTVPAFDTVVSRLSAVPDRRKTIVFVSTGVPLNLGASRGCAGDLADTMRDVLRRAQRANVNIYSIDPAGYRGYEKYLQDPIRGGRPAERVASERGAVQMARVRHDFLEVMAEYTGASAIVNDDDIGPGIDAIFDEGSAYYLVGYQTSNGQPDGKFRKIEVKIDRPDVTVRTSSGYFTPKSGTLETEEMKGAPRSSDLGLVGMTGAPGLPLRAMAVPVALEGRGREAGVAVALTVRLPAPLEPIAESLVVVSNVYDSDGRPGPPSRRQVDLTLVPSTGDELTYDVYSRLTLAPGRYQLRLNATSRALGRSGSVYADIEVPDFVKAPVALSALVLGAAPVSGEARTDALANLLPILPTTARDFAPSDRVVAFLRVFQSGAPAPVPVTMNVRVLDADDATVSESTVTLGSEAFANGRAAPFQFDLPIGGLKHGPYLVTVAASTGGPTPIRRDLVFRVR